MFNFCALECPGDRGRYYLLLIIITVLKFPVAGGKGTEKLFFPSFGRKARENVRKALQPLRFG
jgi:hypothetical protein